MLHERYRKVATGIKKGALKRVLIKTTVNPDNPKPTVRMTEECVEVLRKMIVVAMERIITLAVDVAADAKRKTITVGDVGYVTEHIIGRKFYFPEEELVTVKNTQTLMDALKKKRNTYSGFLVMGKAQTLRLCKVILQYVGANSFISGGKSQNVERMTKMAAHGFRMYLENYLQGIFGSAVNSMATLTKRRTLKPKDLYLAQDVEMCMIPGVDSKLTIPAKKPKAKKPKAKKTKKTAKKGAAKKKSV